jgi:chemotaxis protein CheC
MNERETDETNGTTEAATEQTATGPTAASGDRGETNRTTGPTAASGDRDEASRTTDGGANATESDPSTADGGTDDEPDLRIDVRKLGVLNELGELGVECVEHRLARLIRSETSVESGQVKSGYVEPGSVGLKFDEERRLGVEVRVQGVPPGNVLVLFPPASANSAARLLLRDTDEDPETVSNDMAVSALVELGGMMANGFLDALADTFDQHIAAGAPSAVNSTTARVVERVLDRNDDRGLYLATTLRVTSHDIEVAVYLFPENETFAKILNLVDIDMVSR